MGRRIVAIWAVGESHGARCLQAVGKLVLNLPPLYHKKKVVCAVREWALHKPSMHVGTALGLRLASKYM